MAWSAAYRQFAKSRAPLDVWLVRTIPASRKHPQMLAEWIALDYDIQVLDPGYAESMARARNDMHRQLVRQWYALHLSQETIDARQAARRQRLAALGLRSMPSSVPSSRPEW
jgi:hypothetical protein